MIMAVWQSDWLNCTISRHKINTSRIFFYKFPNGFSVTGAERRWLKHLDLLLRIYYLHFNCIELKKKKKTTDKSQTICHIFFSLFFCFKNAINWLSNGSHKWYEITISKVWILLWYCIQKMSVLSKKKCA